MSVAAFVSFPTRFVAEDWNATNRPFAEMKAYELSMFPSAPAWRG
jgi:hypothetical protein